MAGEGGRVRQAGEVEQCLPTDGDGEEGQTSEEGEAFGDDGGYTDWCSDSPNSTLWLYQL